MEKYQNHDEREYYAKQLPVPNFAVKCFAFQLPYILKETEKKLDKYQSIKNNG